MPKIKQPLLDAVDQFNEQFDLKPQLRVKSKTVMNIVQAVNGMIAGINPCDLYTNSPEGMLDVFAEYEVDLPDAPKKKELKKWKKAQKASEGMSAEAVENEEAMEEATEPPEEPPEEEATEPEPHLMEVERLEAIINNKDLKKKERKKAKKVLKKLLKAQDATSGNDKAPEEKKKSSGPVRGAAARATKTIPESITWPKAGTVTATIIKAAAKKPVTLDKILKKLVKTFPERIEAGMKKTLGALVGGKGEPLPLSVSKGVHFDVENDGTPEKTIHCTDELPEDY